MRKFSFSRLFGMPFIARILCVALKSGLARKQINSYYMLKYTKIGQILQKYTFKYTY